MSSNNEINVLFFFHYSGLNNGAVRSMVDVIERLVISKNVHIVVIYPDQRGTAIDYMENLGVECYHIPFGRWDYYISDSIYNKVKTIGKILGKGIVGLFQLRRIRKIILEKHINVIYSNTSVLYIGALVASLFSMPHIWHIREFGLEDHGISYLFGDKTLIKAINTTASTVIYISKSIENKYSPMINNAVHQNIIYNDISSKFSIPKNMFNMALNNPLRICIIGSLQEGKGQLVVIKAIELLKEKHISIELHIGGETNGKYYEKIKSYVEIHNLFDCVFFDGFITDVNLYRATMDIGVVASSNEAFGRVTIEGMLSMMVMIGADAAGTSELIISEENGLLYKLHDTIDLASKIKKMNDNREEMKRLAINGYRYALNTFAKGAAADKIYMELACLVKNNDPSPF